ncbi:hypothetical protein [Desulfocurvus vexinensis]|uniref:hypothetical protein n=1 Tax=Desulfocurvus vexinensis TaxID=399548 RepID=UPI00048C9DED|nr:hypothetical protein [Desulfocurvus vexinensis]
MPGATDNRFAYGSDIGQLPVLDPLYRPAVMLAVAMYFEGLVDEFREAQEACESDTTGEAHHRAFDALALLCVLRTFPSLLKERDALRADLEARAEGRCRECSCFCDGGFFLPEECSMERKYAEACRKLEAAQRELRDLREPKHG